MRLGITKTLKAHSDEPQAHVSEETQDKASEHTGLQSIAWDGRLRVASVLWHELTRSSVRGLQGLQREALPFQVGDQFGLSEHRR